MRGECRHGALGSRRNVLEIEAAEVAGRLVDCGAYPGFVEDPDSRRRVVGEIVRIRDVNETLERLDRIEGYRGEGVPGSLYRRTVIDVRTASGASERAWIYVLAAPEGFPEIASGAWSTRRRLPGGPGDR